ncbi:MAG: hypothetical protein LH481_08920, partial [Burkholderiales bacterium]|nr:hypothetical protein [Burkholderiales bacterium]
AYCYVASAPITTFHATRMYRSSWFNRTSRYVWLAVWVALTLWICFGSSPNFFLWIIAAPAIWTVFVQILCIMRLHADEPIKGERAPNGIYLWFCKLLTRKEAEQKLGTEPANFVTFYESLVDKRSGEHGVGMRESYTHLREHSNAIFIVLLEVSLAAMIVCLVGAFGGTPKHKLLIVVAVLFVWLIPAVFLWAQANRLERSLISYEQ